MSHPRTPPGTLRQTISRRLPKRPDDSGLTTLEWLLIVAAVAGLAALAVVLVQNVVSDTSEQIAGSSARKTAAQVAALAVQDESKLYVANEDQFSTWAKWQNYYASKCNRIGITYSDAGVSVAAVFEQNTHTATTPTAAALSAAGNATAASGTVRASCVAS